MIATRSRSSWFQIVLLAGCGALLLGRPLAGQTLPSRFTDEQFWRMVTNLSEPTGTFPSENFTSNEVGSQWILPALMRTAPQGGAYLGVGPEQNFTYIAALRPKIAFIVDIRRQAMLQQLLYKTLFEMAPDRASFLSLLFSRARPARPGPAATAQELADAFESLPPDDALFGRTMDSVVRRLTQGHRFALDSDDIEGIRHVFQVIFLAGPHLSYTSGRLLGRGAQPAPGSRSQLVVSYRKGERGRIDTVRSLVTTSATGWVDTIPVTAVARDTRGAVDPDSAAWLMPPAPRSDTGAQTMAAAAELMIRGMVRPSGMPQTMGAVDFASLMLQADSAGVQHGFLASEAQYQAVRDLQLRNLIIPVVGDFAGRQALRGVGQLLRDYRLRVSAFYTSNVEEYLFQSGQWKAFYENLAALPVDSGSTLIRAFLGNGVRAAPQGSGVRVDLAFGSMMALLQAFGTGQITGYADLLPLSKQ